MLNEELLKRLVDPQQSTQQDRIYDQECGYQPFAFSQAVVNVFNDMISRSVPGYWLSNLGIGGMTKRYAQAQSNIYDLGCSLGASSLSIIAQGAKNGANLIAVDASLPMIQRLKNTLHHHSWQKEVHVHHHDILDFPLQNASVVILHYTLQFIPPQKRTALLSRIRSALKPDGVLLISEKIRFDDKQEEQAIRGWHHDFKAIQGYSPLEIEQKSRDIKQVMQIDTQKQLEQRFDHAQFSHFRSWMRCYNFSSYIVFP